MEMYDISLTWWISSTDSILAYNLRRKIKISIHRLPEVNLIKHKNSAQYYVNLKIELNRVE